MTILSLSAAAMSTCQIMARSNSSMKQSASSPSMPFEPCSLLWVSNSGISSITSLVSAASGTRSGKVSLAQAYTAEAA